MDEIFAKYGLKIAPNGSHLYREDLTKRDYSLESTTPIVFSFDTISFQEKSWKNLLPKIVDLMFQTSGRSKEEALAFRTDWTRQAFFYTSNLKSNLLPLKNGLFLNGNFTATHSVWCLQDLLDFFCIPKSECTLIIHRPSGAEPEEVREYFKKHRCEKFKSFLVSLYKYDEDKINRIIANIDFISRAYLAKLSKSYNDLFLFDSQAVFLSYQSKLVDSVKQKGNEKLANSIATYLQYLKGFYAALFY